MIPGVEVCEIADAHLCCGSAGTYNIDQPEIANSLGRQKVANAMATSQRHVGTAEAGKKVLACPGCGAPRNEADPSLTCAYCGTTLREDEGGG